LSRGDGVCRNFDDASGACRIYATRPDICNIEKSFQFFAVEMNLIEYYKANAAVCNSLQQEHGVHLSKRVVIIEREL